jgi:DNA polymerase III gamma/tau subunit
LACGSPGAALQLNLEESTRLRLSILKLVDQAVSVGKTGGKAGEIFAMTAQLAKQEKESFENIITLLYSLLTDLLELSLGPKNSFSRNPDLQAELTALSRKIDFEWILRATQGLDQLESRLRRNISRQLGLDSLLVSLRQR